MKKVKKILMFSAIGAAVVCAMAKPAGKSYANDGYIPGSGPVETYLSGTGHSVGTLVIADGENSITIDSDDFKILAQRIDSLYDQLPDGNKTAFVNNLGIN